MESIDEYVARWKRVGPELDRLRREELRSRPEADHRVAIGSVLALADPAFGRHEGLIEQQRLLRRIGS